MNYPKDHVLFGLGLPSTTSWWLNQPICKKIFVRVKLDHFPKFRGENKTSLKPPPTSRLYLPS